MSPFEIRCGIDSLGDLLGIVEADNVFRAAEEGARRFFKDTAVRETGWGGTSGSWKTSKGKLFYVRPIEVAPPTKPKAKPKWPK